MTQWAQTCNFCGAPLQGARCPRCKYERKPFGEVVFSGYSDGGGGPAPPCLSIELAGTAFAATPFGNLTEAVKESVTVNAGDLLIVHVAFLSGNGGSPGSVTWGSDSLLILNGASSAAPDPTSLTSWYLPVTVTGTHDVTVSFDISAAGRAAVISAIIGNDMDGTPLAGSIAEERENDPHTFTSTPPSAQTCRLSLVAIAGDGEDGTAFGTWTSGYTFAQRGVVPESAGADHCLVDVAYKIGSTTTDDETVGEITGQINPPKWCGVVDQFTP